ncbi:photosystem II protein D2 [Iris pallida]|uniref:Photosystem II protein D2 (Plastid) n=1 Tax=Iris pallida TaxID=29817 RepID=A0AAX6G555_IRIPA|nr:photosystem II protein D2 [Iris pallida]KAJ6823800.1 photosystem II protein D2 [Iris pallida]KAJ6854117.1 photosystem II protein D2 [Iris pallida]
MSFFSLLKSKPLGPLRGSNQGARRSQKRIVSPPKITSPVGERIRYLPKPVGPWADPTLAPRRWSLTRKVNA